MIQAADFTGEGMNRVYENAKWMVGIKNWKPANDRMGIDCLERHNETDESFILLNGECVLVYAVENGAALDFGAVNMEPCKLYTIPKGLWHNTITEKNTKLALIEDASTGMENSDLRNLAKHEIESILHLA